MIYDCFTFFNELDLLRLRLNELNEVIDKFVLVEATRTFQKKPKPLYFNENKHLFKDFESKIIHIVVDKYPNFWKKFTIPTPWDYENHQREQIWQGLKNCKDDNVIIISDLDEIPRAEKVREYAPVSGIKVFEQRLFNYYLNGLCTYLDVPKGIVAQYNRNGIGYWRGSVMLSFGDLKQKAKTIKKTRLQRDLAEPAIKVIWEGGWHFSFLGSVEKIMQKIQSYSHTEIAELCDPKYIEECLCAGKSITDNSRFSFTALDETYPKFLLENPDRFSALLRR